MNDDQTLKAITQINNLTQQGIITWKVDTNPHGLFREPDEHVEVTYEANYGDRRLRLYELEYRDPPDGAWAIQHVLELVGSGAKRLYRFPHSLAVTNLLESVRYQTSNVRDFVKSVLDDSRTINTADIVKFFTEIPYFSPDYVTKAAAGIQQRLLAHRILTIGQLKKLIGNKQMIQWLEAQYVELLGRHTGTPLDADALATWGGFLSEKGFNGPNQAEVIAEIKKSEEYRKRHPLPPAA